MDKLHIEISPLARERSALPAIPLIDSCDQHWHTESSPDVLNTKGARRVLATDAAQPDFAELLASALGVQVEVRSVATCRTGTEINAGFESD
ncbi:hypothetical protein P353_08350 [Comamonas testosteroni]|uniref:Uncharacterized protein n=1 Tax=Comamonas testosteroni TaxID=285 RepID=A0A096HPG1_COMTE|nr:hypothetical protein P353_08350 [Comamonas testosteroni]